MNASSLVNIASGLQPLEKIPLWLRGPCSKTEVQLWQGSWTRNQRRKKAELCKLVYRITVHFRNACERSRGWVLPYFSLFTAARCNAGSGSGAMILIVLLQMALLELSS